LATQKNLYSRRYAVNAIAGIATGVCADHIRGEVGQCLATSDSAAREVAFNILLRGPSELLSKDNIKLVIKWSADKSWRTRRSCALVLAKVQSPEDQAVAKQQLLRLAKDSHSQVRAASLVALGHIEGVVGSDTMKAIFAALNERSDRIQMAACVALCGTHKNFDVRPIVPKLLTVLNSTQETFFTLIRQWIEIAKDNPFPFRKSDKIPFVIQTLATIADSETAELIFDNVLNALRLHGQGEPYYGHIFDDNADEWIPVREVSENALELRYDDYLIRVSDGKLSFVNYTDREEFRFEVSNDPIAELVAKLPVAIRTQKVNVLLNDDNNLIKLIGLRIVRSLKDSLDLAVIEESIIRIWADDNRFLRRTAFRTAGLVFADTNQPATVDALLKQLSIDKDGHEYAWSAIQIVSGAETASQYQSSEIS
jgi:HEAT repeat protein